MELQVVPDDNLVSIEPLAIGKLLKIICNVLDASRYYSLRLALDIFVIPAHIANNLSTMGALIRKNFLNISVPK